MTELAFSFTDCTPVPQEPQLVIPAPVPADQTAFTVKVTDDSSYIYKENIARNFTGWITVSVQMIRNLIARIRAFVRSILPVSGSQILRQSEILII